MYALAPAETCCTPPGFPCHQSAGLFLYQAVVSTTGTYLSLLLCLRIKQYCTILVACHVGAFYLYWIALTSPLKKRRNKRKKKKEKKRGFMLTLEGGAWQLSRRRHQLHRRDNTGWAPGRGRLETSNMLEKSFLLAFCLFVRLLWLQWPTGLLHQRRPSLVRCILSLGDGDIPSDAKQLLPCCEQQHNERMTMGRKRQPEYIPRKASGKEMRRPVSR
ncbi:hypothetical protein J3F83DRAFT_515761 [Trichoderma novae-zelandiae]